MERPTDPAVKFLQLLLLFVPPLTSGRARASLSCSQQPIPALLGDDITLRCHLEPPVSLSSETVLWTKPDVDPKYVYFHENGRQVERGQNPSYRHRTQLSVEELTSGNVAMKLDRVGLSDAGRYHCILKSTKKEASLLLTVGAASRPSVEVVSIKRGSVVLHCKAEGWYPEPELFWLDSERKNLPSGPPQTVRGPDGLYTISSTLAVEKKQGNIFTCRVQQKNITQTRETLITVDFFEEQQNHSTLIIIGFIAILAGHCISTFFINWKLGSIYKLTEEQRRRLENGWVPRQQMDRRNDQPLVH
ncbi:butyrophilin subfamily 1 member A1 [Labrus bergylta]|uniref:butyrophilin subfamily 1 member A1 n=1 Tax=Labrus bergylta TaxID=56723 RepID=UPI0033144349